MPRLKETDRWRAVGMIAAGVRHTDIARQFGVHRNTLDAMWKRYQQFGPPETGLGQGHPRVTSNRQDTYIRVVYLRDRLRIATLTARSIPGQEDAWQTATTSSQTSCSPAMSSCSMFRLV